MSKIFSSFKRNLRKCEEQVKMVRPEFCSIKKPTGIAMGLGAVAAMTFGAYKVKTSNVNFKILNVNPKT